MLKFFSKRMNKKGFTLIELIVVIAILGILMAIALPRLGGFRENAKISSDEAYARTLASAVDMYNATNNATLAVGSISSLSDELGDMVDIKDPGFESKLYLGENENGVPTLAYNAAGNAYITNGQGKIVWEP